MDLTHIIHEIEDTKQKMPLVHSGVFEVIKHRYNLVSMMTNDTRVDDMVESYLSSIEAASSCDIDGMMSSFVDAEIDKRKLIDKDLNTQKYLDTLSGYMRDLAIYGLLFKCDRDTLRDEMIARLVLK